MPLKLQPPRKGKSPHWSVRGTLLGVHVDRSTGLADRTKAAKVLARWRDEIERGEFARPGEPTFLSAALTYIKAGGDPRFVGRFDDDRQVWTGLIAHFGEKRLADIDQAVIDEAATALYPHATSSTRNRQVYTVVSAVLKHAGMKDALRRPKGWRGSQRVTWLKPEQAFAIFAAGDQREPEFGVLLRMLCYTGLRLSEALNLTCDRVELADAFAYIPDTKNDDPRGVYLPPVVVEALAEHPRGVSRGKSRVFKFRKAGHLYELFADTLAAAGVSLPARTGFHVFRHTWATWMRRYGRLDTRGLVGTGAWRDEKSAARYEHVIVSEEARRADLLPTENTRATRGKFVERLRKNPAKPRKSTNV